MQVSDLRGLKYDLGYTDHDDTIGIVFKKAEEFEGNKEDPKLGLIIPKYQLGYDFKSGDQPKVENLPVEKTKCINNPLMGDVFDSTVTIKNFITMRPALNQNQSMPIYTKGDKVYVHVVDGDLKNMFFLPYGINRLGQRAIDRLQFAVPANPKENQKLDEKNTYYVRLDSDEKVIIIGTSKKNGETCDHHIAIDSGEGILTITDGERYIKMNYDEDQIISHTTGSTIEQKEDVINMKADTLNINMDSNINIKCENFKLDCDNSKEKASKAEYEFTKFEMKGNKGKWDIDKEEHTGSKQEFTKTKHEDIKTDTLNASSIKTGSLNTGSCNLPHAT